MEKPYTPIDCNFYDRIEHFAVLRKPIEMVLLDDSGAEMTLEARILDTRIANGVEFILVEGLEDPIRMDRIIRLEGHLNPGENSCAI